MSLSQVLAAGADLRAAALTNELELWVGHTGTTGTPVASPGPTRSPVTRSAVTRSPLTRSDVRGPVAVPTGSSSGTPGGVTRALTRPLAEQTSQILLLRDTVRGLLAAVTQHAQGNDLATARLRQDGIHAVHLIWDFFRNQLAQRMDDDLRMTLTLADDLAEACYRPAVRAAGGEQAHLLQPPLVHFASRPSPYVWPRNNVFIVSGHLEKTWQDFFANTLKALPIPVIGLPWGDAWHLAGLVSVAHEVGHCVYDDLGLKDQAVADISGFPGSDHLNEWASECFADLWGVLGCGVPYVESMAGVLAAPKATLETEDRVGESTAYPTAMLRMHMMLVAAQRLGLDISQVTAVWRDCAPATHKLVALEEMSGALVESWLDASWERLGGKMLSDVIAPPTDADIQRFATEQIAGGLTLRTQDDDARLMVAGLGRAWFSQPAAYAALEDEGGAGRKRLLLQFGQRRTTVVRSSTGNTHSTSTTSGHRAADVDRVAVHLTTFLDALEQA